MQLGNWSTAFFTLAIAVHTFNSLVLRIRQPTICRNCTVFLGWATAFTAGIWNHWKIRHVSSHMIGTSCSSCGFEAIRIWPYRSDMRLQTSLSKSEIPSSHFASNYVPSSPFDFSKPVHRSLSAPSFLLPCTPLLSSSYAVHCRSKVASNLQSTPPSDGQ
jgi:hypothetical protein